MTGPDGTVLTSVNVSTFSEKYYIEVNAPPLYHYDYTAFYYSYDSYWYDQDAKSPIERSEDSEPQEYVAYY